MKKGIDPNKELDKEAKFQNVDMPFLLPILMS
jgi:hypothetical protein